LYNNIVLAGGCTLFAGFGDRLKKDLIALASPNEPNINIISAATDRKNSVCIGGSRFVKSLDAKAWITKPEYDEHGSSIVNQKC